MAVPVENSRRPHFSPQIGEETIRALVHDFYGRVRDDATLGPIFEPVVGGEWNTHLASMCDFWSSVMLATGRYKGNPMTAHMHVKTIRPEHFARWLELFRQAARDTCTPESAERFIGKAENIARGLQLGLFFRTDAEQPVGHPQ